MIFFTSNFSRRKGIGKRFLILMVAIFTLSLNANAQVSPFRSILEKYCNFSSEPKSQTPPYGDQFGNYDFESWESPVSGSVEPAHWNSFMTATGKNSLLSFVEDQTTKSTEVRPGSDGSYSARIFAKTIKVLFISKLANGNITTGRIYVGDSDVNSSNNYNYTERNNQAFNMPISSIPDSLTVWVCFRAASSNSYASVMTAIHGDTDLKQLASGGYDPSNMICATAGCEYARTCASGSSLVWKRLTIPFTAGSHNNPKYILSSFSTNRYPGEGDDGDEVFIDDICLIYRPSLSVDYLAESEIMLPLDGSAVSIEIPFNLSGSMSVYNLNKEDNEVIAQLSDANGSFDNPIELGRVTTNESGVVQGIIPADLTEGEGYRIRVVSTNYPMTSEDNGTDIIVVKEKEPLVPQIEIAMGTISTNAIEATFTPNEDCSYYYIMVATSDEMANYQNDMELSVEGVVKALGINMTETETYIWDELEQDTEYTVYALPFDVDDNYGVMKTVTVRTDMEVDAGVSFVNIYVQVVSPTTVNVTATPNEYTVEYHYIIIEKEYSDMIGIDSTMQMVYNDLQSLYDVDQQEWTVETNVPYYAIACGKNSEGEWGEVTKIEFMAEGESLVEYENLAFNLYPNPATDYVRVSSDSRINELSIFSVDGRMLYSNNSNQYEIIIDLTGYNKGCYIVRMISDGEVHVRRIVKN